MDALGQAVLTLASVVVGGVVAAGGGVWVMHRERTRAHRERIYSELLPELESHVGPAGFRRVLPDVLALQRVAKIASADDREKADVVGLLSLEAGTAWDDAERATDPLTENQRSVEFRRKLALATDAIDDYDAWPKKKL